MSWGSRFGPCTIVGQPIVETDLGHKEYTIKYVCVSFSVNTCAHMSASIVHVCLCIGCVHVCVCDIEICVYVCKGKFNDGIVIATA